MLRKSAYLFSDTGLQRLQAGRLGTRVLVSRSVCTYLQLPCAGVPWLKLRQFAQLHARQAAVYAETGVYALKQGDLLHVWMWDAQALRKALAAEGVAVKAGVDALAGVSVVAQTALGQTQPALGTAAGGSTYSAALFASGSGFEGILLQQGLMVKNHWWAQMPVLADWQRFTTLGGADAAPAANSLALPKVKAYDNSKKLAGMGWQVRAERDTSDSLRARQPPAGRSWAATLCAVVLTLGLGAAAYLAVMDWQLRQAQALLKEQLAAATTAARAQVKAREDLQVAAERVKALASFAQLSLPQELWRQWAAEFVMLGVSVREFESRAGQVRMLVVANTGKLNPTEVVAIVAKNPQITDIKIEINAALQDMRITAAWQGDTFSSSAAPVVTQAGKK